VARRGPFGFENPPAILLRQQNETASNVSSLSSQAMKSGMALLPLSGGKAIPLMKEAFVLGRRADCDLQIQDASVSSRHCELRFDGNHWTINDLNSRNGIRVNGDVVQKRRLQNGDMIIIGASLRLRFADLRGVSTAKLSKRVRYGLLALAVIASIASIAAAIYFYGQSGR
jgi:hypothetical protein